MKQIKVLLIDDDEDDYILTKGIFEKLPSHYSLSWESTHSGGIGSILNKEYDIYLLDYRLDDITGLELLSEAINSGCEQPIIMLTGKGDAKIDDQAMNLGAADYLIKDDLEPSLLERSMRYAIKQTGILKVLQASESKYRIIFEQANDPIIVTDSNGNIIDMNTGGLKFFGYEHKEIIGKNEKVLFKHKKHIKQFKYLLESQGVLNDFECEMVTKQHGSMYCGLSSFIYTDMIAVSEVFYTIVRDLSYRKGLEEESIKLGKLTISEHIAKGFGEEVRDPLSTVNLALDELSADESMHSNETAQACIEIIKSNCDRINQVIKNFISSTESKALNLQKIPIVEVIDEAILEAEDLLAGQHVQLTKQLTAGDSELMVDKAKIKSALINVIKNAAEAIKSFPKLIHITGSVKNGLYEVGVEDNGIGIDPAIYSRIFEPFFTTRMRAVGLGLTQA
ncbi:MAG: hybrid sensor histidine kinase/response regulator, partial [Pedobacter sp.]